MGGKGSKERKESERKERENKDSKADDSGADGVEKVPSSSTDLAEAAAASADSDTAGADALSASATATDDTKPGPEAKVGEDEEQPGEAGAAAVATLGDSGGSKPAAASKVEQQQEGQIAAEADGKQQAKASAFSVKAETSEEAKGGGAKGEAGGGERERSEAAGAEAEAEEELPPLVPPAVVETSKKKVVPEEEEDEEVAAAEGSASASAATATGASPVAPAPFSSGAPSHSSPASATAAANTRANFSGLILPLIVTVAAVLSVPGLIPGSGDAPSPLPMPASVRDHLAAGESIEVLLPGSPHSESVSLFVRSEGHLKGSPEVLLLLHGFGSSSFSFRHLLLPLSRGTGLPVLAVDFPGAGLSDKPVVGPLSERVYSVSEVQRILTSLLDSLGIGGDSNTGIHLVLHDTAGVVGAVWAAENAARVRGLTFVDSPMDPPFPSAFPQSLAASPILASAPGLRALLLLQPPLLGLLLRGCCFRSAATDAETAVAYAYLLGCNGGLRALQLAAEHSELDVGVALAVQSYAEKELGRVPRQILWSSASREAGEEVQAHWPLSDLHFHSGGRWPQEDVPEELVGLIVNFVRPLIQHRQPDHHGHDHHHGDDHGHVHAAGSSEWRYAAEAA